MRFAYFPSLMYLPGIKYVDLVSLTFDLLTVSELDMCMHFLGRTLPPSLEMVRLSVTVCFKPGIYEAIDLGLWRHDIKTVPQVHWLWTTCVPNSNFSAPLLRTSTEFKVYKVIHSEVTMQLLSYVICLYDLTLTIYLHKLSVCGNSYLDHYYKFISCYILHDISFYEVWSRWPLTSWSWNGIASYSCYTQI